MVGQYTHNVVKPISTWLWLSWVLTIKLDFTLGLLRFDFRASEQLLDMFANGTIQTSQTADQLCHELLPVSDEYLSK